MENIFCAICKYWGFDEKLNGGRHPCQGNGRWKGKKTQGMNNCKAGEIGLNKFNKMQLKYNNQTYIGILKEFI